MKEGNHNTSKLDALAVWARSNGASIHPSLNLVSRKTTGSNTIFTTTSIPSSSTLLSIPHSLAITHAKAIEAFPPELSSPDSHVSHYAILAAFLVFEKIKGAESFWYPYIASLPPVETGCGGPMFQSSIDIELWLSGTNLGGQEVNKIKEDWKQDWASMRGALAKVSEWETRAEQLTWELYLWAASMFSSRAFPDSILAWTSPVDLSIKDTLERMNADGSSRGVQTAEGSESKPALFPILDLLNHKPRTKITWQPGKDSIAFVSGNELEQGVEVFNNYGPKPNQQLFLSYGFTIENNPDDTVMLKFQPPLSPYQQALRKQQVSPKDDTGIYHLHVENSSPPDALVQLFRLLVANKWEHLELERRPKGAIDTTNRNEIAAKLQLLNALSRKGELLAKSPVTHNSGKEDGDFKRYATIFRRGQHNILLSATARLNAEIKSLVKKSKIYHMSEFEQSHPEFYHAIETCFGDWETREETGMEEVAMILGIGHLYLKAAENANSTPQNDEFSGQIQRLLQRYPMKLEGPEEEERVQALYDDIFPVAREVEPNIFGSKSWTPNLLGWAARVQEGETCRMVMEGREQDCLILS